MTAAQRSIASATLLALIAYWLCLRFLFPGYFNPLVPHHTDLFIPAGLPEESWFDLLTYPRPVAFSVLQWIGFLGLQGSIAAIIAIVIAGVVLTVVMVQRWMGQTCALLSIACYITVLFAHPEFYFQHRHDVPAAVSYIFLLLAVEFWRQWLENNRTSMLAACSAVAALLVLTKETYAISLVVLFLGFALLREDFRIQRMLRPVLWLSLATGSAIAINLRGYFDKLQAADQSSQGSYRVTLTPASLWNGETFYVTHLLNWASLILVLAAILFVFRNRRRLKLSLLLLAAGISALLPNSLLPNHVFEEYAWAAAPLVFAPLLMVSGRAFTVASVALVALWIGSVRREYHSPARDWTIEQEQQNGRILASFSALKRIDPGARRVLVAGLRTPYAPWTATDFVKHTLGPHQWTMLMPRDGVLRHTPPVDQALGRKVSLDQFNSAVLYDRDGNLIGQLSSVELRKAGSSDPDVVFIPELQEVKAELKQNPNDFGLLLKAGVLYVEWGWPNKAEPYLQRAAEAAKGANPYPYYFLGLCKEDLDDKAGAKGYYQLAVKADQPPGNPFFKPALARVSGP